VRSHHCIDTLYHPSWYLFIFFPFLLSFFSFFVRVSKIALHGNTVLSASKDCVLRVYDITCHGEKATQRNTAPCVSTIKLGADLVKIQLFSKNSLSNLIGPSPSPIISQRIRIPRQAIRCHCILMANMCCAPLHREHYSISISIALQTKSPSM